MESGEDKGSAELYDKYTKINKTLLKRAFLWPADHRRTNTCFNVCAILSLLLITYATGTEVQHIYLLRNDFTRCLEILCNTTTSFVIAARMVVFMCKRETVLKLEAQCRKMWIMEFRNEDNRKMMISAARIGNTLTNLFTGLVSLCLLNFFLAPSISLLRQFKKGVPKEEIVYVLPYLLLLPFDLRDPLSHFLAYIPIIIITISILYTISGVDSLYFVWIQHIILHLRLLQRSLLRIRAKGKVDNSMSDLRICIAKHDYIIRHCAILEEIFSPIILVLCIFNTLSMCMVLFNVVVMKGGSNGNLSLFGSYLAMEVSSILLYCWFGNTLIEESLAVAYADYETVWYEDRPNHSKFCCCIQIMMLRAQKPIKLTAFKFADVSLAMFTTIMKSTGSYFALLRTLFGD